MCPTTRRTTNDPAIACSIVTIEINGQAYYFTVAIPSGVTLPTVYISLDGEEFNLLLTDQCQSLPGKSGDRLYWVQRLDLGLYFSIVVGRDNTVKTVNGVDCHSFAKAVAIRSLRFPVGPTRRLAHFLRCEAGGFLLVTAPASPHTGDVRLYRGRGPLTQQPAITFRTNGRLYVTERRSVLSVLDSQASRHYGPTDTPATRIATYLGVDYHPASLLAHQVRERGTRASVVVGQPTR